MNGTFNVAAIGGTFAMVFNKDEFDRTGRTYPYSVVDEGKWTLAYFESLIQDFSSDNGDNVWDEKDTYGFVATPGYATSFFFGADFSSKVQSVKKSFNRKVSETFKEID